MRLILHFYEDEKFLKLIINKFVLSKKSINIFVKVGNFKIRRVQSSYVILLPLIIINILIPFFHLFVCSVIIHGFFNSILNVKFQRINKNLKILGIFWGFDLYSLNGVRNNYLKHHTYDLEETNLNFIKKLNSKQIYKFINERLDFVSTIVPNEFKILKRHFPDSKFNFLWFSYSDIENDILNSRLVEKFPISGNNLLFGNNLSKWNNHLDGVEIIKSFKFEFENIICPLSYAGNEEYRTLVIKKFNENFNIRFKPINGFLKYSEYLNILTSSRYVFFNSRRQLGLGNLLFSLYIGSIVILDEENPLYQFFSSNNIKVFSIEESINYDSFDFDLEQTRLNLIRIWGVSAVKCRTFELIDILTT